MSAASTSTLMTSHARSPPHSHILSFNALLALLLPLCLSLDGSLEVCSSADGDSLAFGVLFFLTKQLVMLSMHESTIDKLKPKNHLITASACWSMLHQLFAYAVKGHQTL